MIYRLSVGDGVSELRIHYGPGYRVYFRQYGETIILLLCAAEALKSGEAIAVFVTDAFETGDARYIAKALGVVARAKDITRIARETGLAREQLYRSSGEDGNPTLESTIAVMKAIGFEITGKRHAA